MEKSSVFLSCDIEGTCGIAHWDEANNNNEDYKYFQKQMIKEVTAACEGATLGGAEDIFVKDAHWTARNIISNELPLNTTLIRGWARSPLLMMEGLDRKKFKAAMFTGYHAGLGSSGNPLAHTIHSQVLTKLTINDAPASEFLINSYTAGYYGIPVCFISGDKAICEEAKKLIPEITVVPVSEGVGQSTISIHPELALKLIKEGAQKAVENYSNCKVTMPKEFDVSIEFREQKGYRSGFYPGAWIENETTVRFKNNDYFEVLRFLMFAI